MRSIRNRKGGPRPPKQNRPQERPRRSASDGTPIEEAPLWVLAIAVVAFWLVIFPALIGLLDGLDLYRGAWLRTALIAAGLAVALIVGLATRKPWRRPRGPQLVDERPLLVRFSTWLITAVFVPNVLQGVLVLGREGPPPDYLGSLALGLLLSAVHGGFALAVRWRRRRAPTVAEGSDVTAGASSAPGSGRTGTAGRRSSG